MYRDNPLKKRLGQGKKALGCWLNLAHPAIAEIMGLAGYDLVLMDLEHGLGELDQAADMLRGLAHTPAATAVRAPANDPVFLKRILDQGPDAVMIPMVETAEEARAAVAACRYPPKGNRGWAAGVARASSYGLVKDYTLKAADNLVVILQIESVTAVGNIDAIAGVEGVDMLFVGRNDLAASAGHILQLDHPEVNAMLDRVEAAARRAGRWLGTVPSRDLDTAALFRRGFDLVMPASDISLLRDAALKQVEEMAPLLG